jgi:hypothetical protein
MKQTLLNTTHWLVMTREEYLYKMLFSGKASRDVLKPMAGNPAPSIGTRERLVILLVYLPVLAITADRS